MKTFATILVTILWISLGNWIISLEKGLLFIGLLRIFSFVTVGFFAFGVYRALENAEK